MNLKSLIYLWKERTLFIGRLDEPLVLSQGAATLCLSLEDKISVRFPDSNSDTRCSSVLLPPGCTVCLDTRKQIVANVNLDVMGLDYLNLRKGMTQLAQGVCVGLNNEEEFRAALRSVHQNESSLLETKSILHELLSGDDPGIFVKDERVQKVVDLIQSSIGLNLSTEHLAKQVNLSVPGLTKLFKHQTGVPIRRYRQWHRLYTTAVEIGKGRNLTDAALAAGFVDLPHCTHTFNLMLGMKPSYFLLRPDKTRIFTEHTKEAPGLEKA